MDYRWIPRVKLLVLFSHDVWSLVIFGSPLFCAKHQKIIHAVFDEIILFQQLIHSFVRFTNHNVLGHAVVLTIAIAVNHSYFGSSRQGCPKVTQQCDWLSNLVIRLQQEHSVDLFWQERVVRLPEYRFDVVQVLFSNSRVDVTNGLRIDIDGIHGSSVPDTFRRTDCEPPGPCSDISDRFAGSYT